MLDACHMVKLARNALAQVKVMMDADGHCIKWNHITLLHDVQKKEGLNFANKIGVRHIDFVNQKMKVNLAAQVLSSSVADAIQFLMDSGVPGFEDAKGTILFIKKIDQIFDLLNSRTPFANGWKRPLSFGWMEDWSNAIDDTITYLNGLTAANGVPMKNHGRKTFVKGFDHYYCNVNQILVYLAFDKRSQFFQVCPDI